ncbi:MAG: diaminobutyrate--2-oxoglutarate transaminase [Dehalococcoidia bacterium]|nr:diaminobutyrate--2-oxoglutarate transaminase [Dehalococcoidia bacterium]
MSVIEEIESNVRSYVRAFPVIFDSAEGALLRDEQGNEYIDFFAGAGVLNYGHNHPAVNKAIIEYLQRNGVVHSLDMATSAKIRFLETFREVILAPRNLDYKVQFTGPTGTNAVEAALKLVRMAKGRANIISFTNGYHGHTLGALAATGNDKYRDVAYGWRINIDHMPFDGYLGEGINTVDYIQKFIRDTSSGVDLPAAVIVETVQGEGGINVASSQWLKDMESLCKRKDIALIVDDIQVGNGRTGRFFSFEEAGITPDIVCLSKAIGGGLPMAILLIRPELDLWEPGRHTGTFRGNNLAFVASTEMLNLYWRDDTLSREIAHKGEIIQAKLQEMANKYPELGMSVRGRGMVWGLELPHAGFAAGLSVKAFERQLITETSGSERQVLKLLPPLVIEEELLRRGLDILAESLDALVEEKRSAVAAGGKFL